MTRRSIGHTGVVAALFFGPIIVALLLVPRPADRDLVFEATSFNNLPGWRSDNQAEALAAFKISCTVLTSQSANKSLSARLGGRAADWADVCSVAGTVPESDRTAAREFFENNFTPLVLSSGQGKEGKLTGYYEPLIEGSATANDEYQVPLYKRPPELVTVNLGLFRKDLEGRRVAGRVRNGRLTPFDSRSEIDAGALKGKDLELFWLRDPVDAFFLHIQGSGRIQLPDGSFQRVGFDGPNGRPYTSIGRVLLERGEMVLEEISMQSIRSWIVANPEKGTALMQENASYVFFRLLEGDGPLGSMGVALSPGRSLAVDQYKLPLGAPLYLAGTYPDPAAPDSNVRKLERLMIAQDTGGAIRGSLRGDVFWGLGEEAEVIAGHMNNPSRFYLLLPQPLAVRLLAR
ncbi:MAG: murein transglycosylase A [Proteobacteria bacterium]|nr:murein transglycosylase A [Pseudomonadota bacterium]